MRLGAFTGLGKLIGNIALLKDYIICCILQYNQFNESILQVTGSNFFIEYFCIVTKSKV